jgi:hypothetical protein
MRWHEITENLSQVTGEDVRDLYASIPPDLETLLSGHDADAPDFLDIDWSGDVARLKRMLLPYSTRELTLFRAIRGKPDLQNLGIHWSISEETVDFGQTLITARVSQDAIDWVGTVARGIHWWEDEQEITLFRECDLTILSIRDIEDIDPEIKGPIRGRT